MKNKDQYSRRCHVLRSSVMGWAVSMACLGWAQSSEATTTNAEATSKAPVANEKTTDSKAQEAKPKKLNIKPSFYARHNLSAQEALADRLRVITEEYIRKNKTIPEDEMAYFREKAIAAYDEKPCMGQLINYSDGVMGFHSALIENKNIKGLNSDGTSYQIDSMATQPGDTPFDFPLSNGQCALVVSKFAEEIMEYRMTLFPSAPAYAQLFEFPHAPWLNPKEQAVGVCANRDMKISVQMMSHPHPGQAVHPLQYEQKTKFVRKILRWRKDEFPQFIAMDMKYTPYERCDPVAYETQLMSPLPGTLYYYGNKPYVLADVTHRRLFGPARHCRLYDIGLLNDEREETMVDCRYLTLKKPQQVQVTADFESVYSCTHSHEMMNALSQCMAAVDKKYGKQLDALAREMDDWRYSREHRNRYNRAYNKYQNIQGKVDKEKYDCRGALAKKVAQKYKVARTIQKVNQFYQTNTISNAMDLLHFKRMMMCAVDGIHHMYLPEWLR